MRKRRWVLVILLLVIGAALLPLALERLRLDEKARTLLISQLQPMLGDSCRIERVGLSFSNLHLYGLSAATRDRSVTIHIQDLRLGLAPLHLLRHGLQPRAFTRDVMIKKPVVIFHAAAGRDSLAPPMRLDQLHDYLRGALQLDLVERLSIIGGEIRLEIPGREGLTLASHLEGWIASAADQALQLRLRGQPFRSTQSVVTIDGRLALNGAGTDTLRAAVRRLPLRSAWPWPQAEGIEIRSGELDAEIALSLRPGQSFYSGLSGRLQLRHLTAAWPRQRLRMARAALDLELRDEVITLRQAEGWINETPVALQGTIRGIQPPLLSLQLQAPEIDLQAVKELLPEQARRLTGTVALSAAIGGSPAHPRLDISASARHLADDATSFQDAALTARWQADTLDIRSLRAVWRGLQLAASGRMTGRTDSSRLQGTFSASGDLRPLIAGIWNTPVQQAGLRLAGTLSGTAGEPAAQGSFSLALTTPGVESLTTRHDFSWAGRRIRLQPAAGEAAGWSGTVDWAADGPRLALRLASAAPWLDHAAPPLAGQLRRRGLDIAGEVAAQRSGYTFRVALDRRLADRPAETLLTLAARADLRQSGWDGDGSLTLWPGQAGAVAGRFTLQRDSTRFVLRDFTIGDWFSGVIQVNKAGQLTGSCFLQDLPIESLLDRDSAPLRGILAGEVEIHGTLGQPRLRGNLALREAWYGATGPFTGEGAFNGGRELWTLERLQLHHDGDNLCFAHGWYQPGTDSLYFRLQGAGFEMSRLSPAFMPGERPLTGQTTADLEFSGTRRQPRVAGYFGIRSGSCYGAPFDELQLRLGALPASRQPAASGGLYLQRFALHRKGVLNMVAEGVLPFSPEEEMEISLQGAGNFLALLSDLNSWFMESDSDGRLSVRIGGSRRQPQIRAAELVILNGRLRCENVLPLITEMTARFEYQPQRQFIRIAELQGMVGGRPVRISNQLNHPGIAARPLANLVFPRLGGLNLGVISLETGAAGVVLHIPGLMDRDQVGTAWFEGRTAAEKFYCAGPIEHPLFRGLVRAANTRFMFPFDETLPVQEESLVLDILFSAEWDVAVRTLEDVRYVKFIPGGIDKVYANILIEEGSDDLLFSGVWNDSTLRIAGDLRTSSGVVEYLDMTFRIEQGGASWDHSSLFPLTWGQARTTVTDSLGFTSQIFLTVQTVDETLDKEVEDIYRQEERRGRWDKIRFKLSSDNPNLGSTEAQLLASLGYSERTLQAKAVDVIGINTENYLLRPFFRPVERSLEQMFRFDYVRFSSRFTRNFLNANLNNNAQINRRLALLRSSKLILGKFIARSIFVQYTGQIETGVEYRYQDRGVGLRHSLGLEYRISPQVLLELEYNYDSLMLYNRDDKRVMVRHWFPL